MTSRVRVKICGLTRREDAQRAADLGADFLGVIFAPKSPRFVTPEQAREVLDFSPRPKAIGVFVNATVEEMLHAKEVAGLDGFQLHGDEDPDMIFDLPGFRIKVVKVKDESSLDTVDEFESEAVLCDTAVAGMEGGTGQTFDHSLVVHLAERRHLFLAGGLNPDNVVEAAQLVKPFAVDTSSGVEAEPGVKDHAALENFFARLAAAGLR